MPKFKNNSRPDSKRTVAARSESKRRKAIRKFKTENRGKY